MSALEWLRAVPPLRAFAWSILLALLLGLVDFRTGWELSFSIFYLLPIALASWGAGAWAGVLLACVSVALGFGTDQLAGRTYSSAALHTWNIVARLGIFATVAISLSALRMALDVARAQADMDPLTGLPNARFFLARLEHELAIGRRESTPLAMAYVDLDNFKAVNDTWGHQAGDDVLRTVAQTVRASLRETDLVARMGGDEFAILLPRTAPDAASTPLRKIMTGVHETIRANGWPISLSVGAVTVEGGAASAEQLVHAADEVMYEVKRTGKGDLAVRRLAVPSQG